MGCILFLLCFVFSEGRDPADPAWCPLFARLFMGFPQMWDELGRTSVYASWAVRNNQGSSVTRVFASSRNILC